MPVRGPCPNGTAGRRGGRDARPPGIGVRVASLVERGEPVERTADDVVAAVFSLSSSAPHLFGDRLADFEADLRSVLAEASPGGRFTERAQDIELAIWSP